MEIGKGKLEEILTLSYQERQKFEGRRQKVYALEHQSNGREQGFKTPQQTLLLWFQIIKGFKYPDDLLFVPPAFCLL